MRQFYFGDILLARVSFQSALTAQSGADFDDDGNSG
jgi:hypothetical protein